MAAVKTMVSAIVMVKIKKRPITKAKISVFLRSMRVYPITIGITGKTQGDSTEAIPAKNENKGIMFIKSP